MTRLIAATVAAVVALVVVPSGASAAVTCDLSSGVLEVAMSASEDTAALSISATDEILVDADSGEIDCAGGTPATTTTAAISVHNAPGLINNRVIISNPHAFAPGQTPEPGDDEIEIALNLNGTPGSVLELRLGTAAQVVAGSGGINPNAAPGEDQPDADILNVGTVRGLVVLGSPGADLISVQGGRGTGGPLSDGVVLVGRDGADVIQGGNGGDDLYGDNGEDVVAGFGGTDAVGGGPGTDVLTGGEGADSLYPDSGADLVDGGPGEDTLDYADAQGGVSADLEGTGAEHLLGTAFADVLIGDSGPNTIAGRGRDDLIDGRGGADSLDAGPGADTLLLRDGVSDSANCGADADSVTADAIGVDLVTGCETVVFPPVPDPGGPPPVPDPGGAPAVPGTGGPPPVADPGDPGGGAVAPTVVPAFRARTLVTLALARKRVRAPGPIAVRISNANPFAVTGTISGDGGKRRLALGRTRFSVAPNTRVTVRLRLPEPLRRRFANSGRLSLRLVARVRDPAGTVCPVLKRLTARLQTGAR